jgi:GNAT superfamily N-acetyltransferase
MEHYKLIEATTPEERGFVHNLRRAELFERKHVPYNPDHPANHAPGRFTLILKLGDKNIATASLDLLGNKTGAIRMVAVTKEEQRKGHGRILQETFEEFAKGKEVVKLFVNANKVATGFYEKLGYGYESWNDAANILTGDSIQMSKVINS